MRRSGARPPLLCGGGSRSQRGARRGRWLRALSACGRRRGRRVLRGGRHRAALAAQLHAAPLVCSTRPPCRRIRCGVVALGRRSSAAAARALSAVRVVVGGGARSLRAAVDEFVAFFGAAAVALLSRRRSTRRSSCALRARRAAASDAAWWRSAAAPLRRRLALSARCASWSVAAGALCVQPSTRSSRPSGRPPSRCSRGAAPRGAAHVLSAPAVPPHPMRRDGARPPLLCGGGSRSQHGVRRGRWRRTLPACGRRRGRRLLRGGRRRTALAAPLHAAQLVCSLRPPCRRIRCGVVVLGRRTSVAAARALSAVRIVVGGSTRSLRAAVDKVVAFSGRPPSPCSRGAASRGAARVLYAPAVPPHPMRRGGARPPLSAAAARALSAVRVVVGGCARSLRTAVGEFVASFGAAAIALLSPRRSTRRRSCALRARRAAASDAAWWRLAAAPLRRRLVLSARCALWSVSARALCVRPSTRSSRSSGRPPSRCSRGATARGAARVLYTPAVPPHPMRRGGARPPLLCGGGSCSQRDARRARLLRALSACGHRQGRRVLRGGRHCAALAAPLHAAPLVCSTRPPCRRIRCGVVALGRRSSAVAVRALSAVRVVPGCCERSLRAAVDEVVASFGAAAVALLSRRRSTRRRSCSLRARRVLYAPAVPPHPMRRGGARPPLLCGGSSRSQRGARRGRWLLALSACGCRRGRHVFGATAVALLSQRRSTRRRSCALRARCAAASDVAWRRSAAAPLRRRLALSAWCASWSVAARALCVRPSTRSSRLRGDRRRAALAAPLHAAPLVCSTRPLCRRIRCGVAALGRRSSAAAARALSAVVAFFGAAAVALLSRRRPTRRRSCALRARRAAASDAAWWRLAAAPLRRRLALSAWCASWSVAACALCVPPSTRCRIFRGGRHRAALAAPLHAAPLVCSTRPPCRRIRCGVAALGRCSSAAAARALSAGRVVVGGCARSLRAAVDEVVTSSGRPPSRCSRSAAPRGAARVLYAPAVPPHPMRRGGARPPLLCGGGSRSQRGRRVLRGGRRRLAPAAPPHAAPLVCSTCPPCRRIRCGVAALGRCSSAAAARALSAVRVVVGGCARSLRAAVDEAVASFVAAAVALLSRRRSTRRRSCALRVRRAAASDAAWWRLAAAPLRRRLALSAWCASWSVAARALCVRPSTRSSRLRGDRRRAALAAPLHAAPLVCSTRPLCRRIRCGVAALGRRSSAAAARALSAVVAFFGAAAVALLSRRRPTRRRSWALRARRAAASDAAWRRSAAAPLRRRLALSARCASWSVAARALCVRPSTRPSRPSWRPPSRCSRGAAPRGAVRVLYASAVPPHPMRRGGARPPLLCGGSRSQRGARRGLWLRALSACGRRRGRRILRGGRHRVLSACGRRRGVASFGAAAIALLLRRRSTRRRSCALRACRAAASEAAWWRSAAAPLRRRLALSARCASWSVAARALCVRPSTRSARPSWRSPTRCSRGAAPRGAARVLQAPAVPPHPMRRGGAWPPLLCGGGSPQVPLARARVPATVP